MNNLNKELNFLDIISLGSAGLGVYNTILNTQQLSNDDLLKQLIEDRQNEINEIVRQIKDDNERILKVLLKHIDRKEEKYD